MKRLLTALVLGLSLLFASGGISSAEEGVRAKSENDVATLYRDSVVLKGSRTHLATFDSDEEAYQGSRFDLNWINCQSVADLVNSQPQYKTKLWCEKGFYKE